MSEVRQSTCSAVSSGSGDLAHTAGSKPNTTNITLNIYSHVVEGMQTQAAENVTGMIFGNGS